MGEIPILPEFAEHSNGIFQDFLGWEKPQKCLGEVQSSLPCGCWRGGSSKIPKKSQTWSKIHIPRDGKSQEFQGGDEQGLKHFLEVAPEGKIGAKKEKFAWKCSKKQHKIGNKTPPRQQILQ